MSNIENQSIKDQQDEKVNDHQLAAEIALFPSSSSEFDSTFTEPMETSSIEEQHTQQSAMVDETKQDDTNKPFSKLHHNELIEKAETMFGETKECILDMIQELQDLRREQELAKYQSLCSKDLDSTRATSLAEIDIVSSIVKKNEQERERLERHYMERIKELSSERDLLMKESLDSKLKLEAQQVVFEQIKRKNIEMECTCSLLKEQNKKLISTLNSTQQAKEEFQLLFEKIQSELTTIKSQIQSFETIAISSSVETEKTKKKLASLDSLLKQTVEENTKLQKENTQLRKIDKKP